MMIIGVLLFTLFTLIVSYRITKGECPDKGVLATVVVLISWGSFFGGLALSRLFQANFGKQ